MKKEITSKPQVEPKPLVQPKSPTYEEVSSTPFGNHKDAPPRPSGEIKPEPLGPVPAK